MDDIRARRAKLNMLSSLLSEIVILVCGFIIPRMIIRAYGSEANGATASITQFLAYITLLEGGIGSVARAAFYKPLADGDISKISAVYAEIKRFFRVVAYIYVIYVLILACTFRYISHITYFDWLSTFALVIVISISTFVQYFIGISNSVLLQAAQKTYISRTLAIFGTVMNAILVIVLIHMGCSLIIVKLGSSIVYAMRPVLMWAYVRKNYQFVEVTDKKTNYLSQKWTGLGQHIAQFLHSNTDIAVLTVFVDLSSVSVYYVNNMIVSSIQNVTGAFNAGRESLFGDMLAKKEYDLLQKTFNYYETLMSFVTVTLFSATAVLTVPFVRIYTRGIGDVDYVQPLFALLMIISSMLYCLRSPYHSMVIAAGHFKQTQAAAYSEAIVNIVLSIALVMKFKLVGVAIGTIAGTLIRFIFYVVYLSKNIFYRKVSCFVKRCIVNTLAFVSCCLCGELILSLTEIDNYVQWIFAGVAVGVAAVVLVTLYMVIFYREDMGRILSEVRSLVHKKAAFPQNERKR